MVQTRNQRRWKLNVNDFINRLPDDILLNILSKLKMKEAARTSVLSTRWRYLWTLNTTSLNIDASEFVPNAELKQDKKHSRMKTLEFVKTADQILRQHRGQTIDELRIMYPIGASETHCDHRKVDGWIDIARKKQVKALHFNFKPHRENPGSFLSLGWTAFFSLVTLHLKFASLSCLMIHCLLSNSPNLEELSIIRDNGFLQQLKISGPSLKLKLLELLHIDIQFLEISAPKLLSFNFSTKRDLGTRICFKDVPLLAQLSYCEKLTFKPRCDYYILLPQLETLTLILSNNSSVAAVIPHFPVLENLKQLHLTFGSDMDGGLCLFFRLFKASPSLCRLSLNFGTHICPPLKQKFIDDSSDHKFLKEVEIDGFSGSHYEVQHAICIAQSSSSLEKLIIQPSLYKTTMFYRDHIFITNQEYVKSIIKKLASWLPQKELEILLEVRNPPTWENQQDWEMF